MSDTKAAELGLTPLARIVSTAVTGLSPEIMGYGPVDGPGAAELITGGASSLLDVHHTAAGADTHTWPPPTRMLRVAGKRLRVAVSGEGPPLLLLNGIGGNLEMWGPVADRLRGRQIIAFDAPGTGGSPPLLRPVRMRGYARLVVALLDELGIERADVLGYSWGGALAQELAYRAPSRVGAVVLGATMPGLGGQPPPPWVIALMATPARYYSRTYLRIVAPLVFGSPRMPGVGSAGDSGRLRRPPTIRGYAQQLSAISGWSSRTYLRKLRAPVLVLAGARDPLVPLRNARILAREIPGARLHILDGGHLFLLEQPDQACPLIDEFLDEQIAGSSRAEVRSST